MNKQRVVNIIREPLRMEHEKDLPLIKELIAEFPYFAAPYVLLTKLLSEQKSIYLDKYLKLSAGYIGNREVLYHLLHSAPKVAEKKEPVEIKETISHISTQNNTETESISTEPLICEPEELTDNEPFKAAEFLQEEKIIQNTAPEITEKEAEPIDFQEEAKTAEAEKEEVKILANEISEKENIETKENDIINSSSAENNIAGIKEKNVAGQEAISAENEPVDSDKSSIERKAEEEKNDAVNNVAKAENGVAKPEKRKETELSLPPLAAFDYFAYQERTNKLAANPKIEKTVSSQIEVPVAAEKIKEKNEVNTKISFADWLVSLNEKSKEATVKKPETVNNIFQKEPKSKSRRTDLDAIISKFIEAEPKIRPKPAKFFTPQDVAERSAEEDNTLATETLANIYLNQGLNEKAIEIFQQLILKYPQKSNYFAVKIQEINTKAV